MSQTERTGRNTKSPVSSNNARLESLFSQAGYINREYVIPCPAEPLYIDPSIPSEVVAGMEHDLRFIITSAQFKRLGRASKRQVEVRASPEENGRVLEADSQVIVDGKEYILGAKGGGATSFIRTGRIDHKQKVLGLFGQPRQTVEPSELVELAFSAKWGWLDYKDAHEELVRSQDLEALGVDAEKVIGIYRIAALPDKSGVLQPIDYFKNAGFLPEQADPVLLFRLLRENIRLQDIARLEDLDQFEAAATLIQHGTQLFVKNNGMSGNFSEKDYFEGMSQKVINGLLPLFLRGYRFSAHSWHDTARNISLVGEKVDVGEFRAVKRGFMDVGDFLFYQGDAGNNMYIATIVLLRFAEQIRRYTPYNLTDAPDLLKQTVSNVVRSTDFREILGLIEDTEVEKRNYYRGRPIPADELQWVTDQHIGTLIERLRKGYDRNDISSWVFQASAY